MLSSDFILSASFLSFEVVDSSFFVLNGQWIFS